ncbi:MAG: tetratricopeptide repeat protein [Chloroflexi bacterium]|nr:tetratricopeptide repeat protein [Chloroflexota bacterium]
MPNTPVDPEIALSYAARGRALLTAGQDVAALDAFQRAAWLAPDEPRVQWALANTLWRLDRREEAVPVYERVIELLPNEPAPRCNLAELLAVLGRVNDARVQIAAARAVASNDPHLHFAEAIVRLAQRRPSAAEESARQALASGILPKFAYLDLGDALLAQDRAAEALAAYRVARQHCAAEDLRTMRQDLRWLATIYPALQTAAHAEALAIFAPEAGRG